MENEIVTFVIELSTPKMALKLLKHTVTQKKWIRKWHNVLLWVYGLCISHQVTYSTCLMRQHSSHVTALRIQLCAAYLLFKQIRNLLNGKFCSKKEMFQNVVSKAMAKNDREWDETPAHVYCIQFTFPNGYCFFHFFFSSPTCFGFARRFATRIYVKRPLWYAQYTVRSFHSTTHTKCVVENETLEPVAIVGTRPWYWIRITQEEKKCSLVIHILF